MRGTFQIVCATWLLLAGPLPGDVQVALVSVDDTGQAMGVYAGMEGLAREWSGPGEDVELICVAGIHAPADLRSGVAEALGRGADAVLVWADARRDAPALAALREAGVPLLVPPPWELSPPAGPADAPGQPRVRILGLAELAEAGVAAEPGPGARAQYTVVLGDAPLLAELLRRGAVSEVRAPPAETWGRSALHAVLSGLDPAAAPLIAAPPTPAVEVFKRSDVDAYTSRWARWLAVEPVGEE